MKKIIILVLSFVVLMPTISFAALGYGANVTDCVVWREGMPLPTTVSGYNGKAYCREAETTARRLYELELVVDSLRLENAQLRGILSQPRDVIAGNYNQIPDQTLISRVAQLEFKVNALEKRVNMQENTIVSLKSTIAKIQKIIPTTTKK